MGQAVGLAAVYAANTNATPDVRAIDFKGFRKKLQEQGAILEGTH
jgi:hypothetical protein